MSTSIAIDDAQAPRGELIPEKELVYLVPHARIQLIGRVSGAMYTSVMVMTVEQVIASAGLVILRKNRARFMLGMHSAILTDGAARQRILTDCRIYTMPEEDSEVVRLAKLLEPASWLVHGKDSEHCGEQDRNRIASSLEQARRVLDSGYRRPALAADETDVVPYRQRVG